ncbi:MAG: hypothetical protein PHO84_03330 [Dysgonamonadaceae bacterium]|jgi:hypothetical protein|nr:hypothetical protein [Dysgonamonadaceae bacterium]MDD3356190.1 hypothetical protein [Dysgonamonadaceae bacterium]MDD3728462.1 hypothetical protein [Dysgonamonadaceae bacterium]MDD4246167.1 hypothetical protein [Dysgonamonadaceae bacterium]MDD4606502.1 hypothetical protein [Dysgonamonadaceae bacterium]
MKKRFFPLTLAIIAISMVTYSCADNPKRTAADNELGKIEVEIPASLKNKPEVVTYIHDMNKIADDYAMLIDQVLSDLGGLENKEDLDNLSMMDKIKLMKVSAEVGFKSIDIMSKWGDYHSKVNFFKEDLTEDEAVALEAVLKRFEKRMEQIEEKHYKFFDE